MRITGSTKTKKSRPTFTFSGGGIEGCVGDLGAGWLRLGAVVRLGLAIEAALQAVALVLVVGVVWVPRVEEAETLVILLAHHQLEVSPIAHHVDGHLVNDWAHFARRHGDVLRQVDCRLVVTVAATATVSMPISANTRL